MAGINYGKVAEKFRPDNIKTLLVGEAPPPSGDKYFYLPKEMSKASLEDDTSLPATIFGYYFDRKPESIKEYEEFLERLREMGVFLIDITDEPLKIRDRSHTTQSNQQKKP